MIFLINIRPIVGINLTYLIWYGYELILLVIENYYIPLMKVKGLIIIFLLNSSFFLSAQTEIKEIKFKRYYWEKYDGLSS